MSVQTRIIDQFETFGRVLAVDNGHIEAYVTLDVGPRVIRLAKPGGPNLFFADAKGLLTEEGPELKAAYGPDAVYRFFGGHRLWMSPEYIASTYAPDNDPVTVTTLPDGAVFTPPPQGRNGLQFSLRLSLAQDAADVAVEHVIENVGAAPVTLAPWAITQLTPGGVEIVPQSKQATGLLADRWIAVWPYTDLGDPRVTWGDNALLLRQESTAERAFKLGFYNREGWAAYLYGDTAFVKRFSTPDGEIYPDSGMNFETFTNQHFIEMESLGPVKELAPGARAVHNERWSLYPAPALDRNDLAAALAYAKTIL
jgi:hypothetical protein